MAEGEGFLMRFEDGPLASKVGIKTLAGTAGNFEVTKELFGWPLPDRLGVLTHDEADNVALWDADDPAAAKLPSVIIDSPNAVVYSKVGESQLSEDLPMVMRGARYRVET